MSLHTTAATRFDSFNLYRTSYKKIGDHEIEVNVLVPKDIKPGKRPVLIKWHGGGLSTGTAAYPDWFSSFFVPFLHRNNAITILPNYRLTPEHNGDAILSDIASFGTWFTDSLPNFLASKDPSISPDYSKVLVSGESAGGWCALQAIFTLPQIDFKACFIQYPVVSAFPTKPDELIMGYAIPPKEELDRFLESIVPGTVVSSVTPPERNFVSTMLRAYGRWGEFFGTAKYLMPDTRIEETKLTVPTYIVHGKDDSVVGVRFTEAFVEKVKKLFPETKIELVTRPGEHGFDGEIYEEDEPWLGQLLGEIEQDWLA